MNIAVWISIIIIAISWANIAQCGSFYARITKSGTVRIGLPYNCVPQGFLKQNGEWVGFEIDLSEEMAKHMNLKLEKVKVNEKTWGPMLSKGQIDAALCRIVHSRSLENEFDFSGPYFYDSPQILTIRGNIKNPADLKGHKIAAVQGSIGERNAMKLLRQIGDDAPEKNVVSFPDRPSCFMALGKEKVAGWLDSGMILLEYASRSPGRFELIPASDNLVEVVVALPQDDSAWRDLVNFTIQDMIIDGTYQKIYTKWFGPETPYSFPLRRSIDTWPE